MLRPAFALALLATILTGTIAAMAAVRPAANASAAERAEIIPERIADLFVSW